MRDTMQSGWLKSSYLIKSIGLIILAIILYNVNLSEVWHQLKLSEPFFIVAAVILIIPQVSLRAYRWHKMLTSGNINCSFSLAFSFYFAGIYLGLMTPGRLGEVAKALFLKARHLATLSQSLPSIIFDRFLDLYLLSLVVVVSLYHIGLGIESPQVGILIFLTIGGIPWMLIRIWPSDRISNWIGLQVVGKLGDQWGGSFDAFSLAMKQLISGRKIHLLVLTIISYGVFFLQTWWIACSVGLTLNYMSVAMVVSVAILTGYVPITIAGLGTREAVLIYLFGKLGVSAASALSFALIYNLVYIICMGGVSAIFWFAIPQTERRLI